MVPAPYDWLNAEVATGHPALVVQAAGFYGLHEAPGASDNLQILRWANQLHVDYFHDETPWCGLFMAAMCLAAGKPLDDFAKPDDVLWALNWQQFGEPAPKASLGDILVFTRPTQTGVAGHVGLYVGEDKDAFHVLGGNEGDAVAIVRISRIRLRAQRQPHYTIRPRNAKPILLQPSGRRV